MTTQFNKLDRLKRDLQFRDGEIDLLSGLISSDIDHPRPPIVVSGFKAVGKSLTVEGVLSALGIKHSLVRCDECITRKLLLQRCLTSIKKDRSREDLQAEDYRWDTFAGFMNALESIFQCTTKTDPYTLILDRIDECFEPVSDLIPAFCHLTKQLRSRPLQVIFILSSDYPRQITSLYLPSVNFTSYTETQVASILEKKFFCWLESEQTFNTREGKAFWTLFCSIIVDIFYSYTGSDINLIMDLCRKIWPLFIEPVLAGQYNLNEFVKVYKQNQGLFQDTNATINGVQRIAAAENAEGDSVLARDLPLHSKFILIASYLASYNDARSDVYYFSRIKANKRKRKRESRKGQVSREDIDKRMLSAGWFDLERMTAILTVLYRDNSPSFNAASHEKALGFQHDQFDQHDRVEAERLAFTLTKDTDLNSQIATLLGLGLLVKTAASNVLNPRVRWKINVEFSTVDSLAKDLNLSIADYLSTKE